MLNRYFTYDNKYLLSGSINGQIVVWSIDNMKQINLYEDNNKKVNPNEDYQVLQAINYLKNIGLIKNLKF